MKKKPFHLNSFDALCEKYPCGYCYLKPYIDYGEFEACVFNNCHVVTPQNRYIPGYEIGIFCGKTVIQVAENRYMLPEHGRGGVKILRGTPELTATKINMRIEAEFLYDFSLERDDLLYKKRRYTNARFGKGLFAKKEIPPSTVLGFYPGEFITNEELKKRMNRPEEDRFVFQFRKYFIDGTYMKKKLLIYANDESDRNSNCVARIIETKSGCCGPFIVTKRYVPKDEEITYSYGDYPYEWRKPTHAGRKKGVDDEKSSTKKEKVLPPPPKKKYRVGRNHKYTPQKGNLIGKRLPKQSDREKLAKLILKPFYAELSRNIPQALRSAKGCSRRKKRKCIECGGLFTYLMRHNCKGLASDGGLVAQRVLKFCPLCVTLEGHVQYLPRHLRSVHGIERTLSTKISSSYSEVMSQYHSGRLEKSGYWDVHDTGSANPEDSDERSSMKDLFEDSDESDESDDSDDSDDEIENDNND